MEIETADAGKTALSLARADSKVMRGVELSNAGLIVDVVGNVDGDVYALIRGSALRVTQLK